MIKRLLVDFDKCTDCGMCEAILAGFRDINGKIATYLPEEHVRPEVRLEIDAMISICPERAIYQREYPDEDVSV